MASGKIVGVCKGTNPNAYTFWVEWSASANAAGNYSILTAYSYVQRNDGYPNSAYDMDLPKENKYIAIDGEKTYATELGLDTEYSNKALVAKVVSKKIYHNADGQKAITISSEFFGMGSSSLTSGSLSKRVSLDTIDTGKPSFSENPHVVEISQTSATIGFDTADAIDKIEYSIDGQKTWVEVGSKSFSVDGLSPATRYQIFVRIRKQSNKKTAISGMLQFETEAIYIESISVDDPILLDLGKAVKVNVSYLPENASKPVFRFVADNEGIVSVDGTTLIGLAKGTVGITIFAEDGGGAYATTTAIVAKRVSGVSVYPAELILAKGTTIELPVSISPADADNKIYSLSSSDSSVVSVSGSSISAIENGTAIITAKTEDGGYSAECFVTVVGQYTWYDYSEPLEILNAEDVQHIYSNMQTIHSLLVSKGYSLESLNEIDAQKSTPLIEMLALLQNIEYNLDRLNNPEILSIYYIEPKIIGDIAPDINDIWRWVQILNEMYNILMGDFGKWQYILLNDGYPTINGRKLLIRGENIG